MSFNVNLSNSEIRPDAYAGYLSLSFDVVKLLCTTLASMLTHNNNIIITTINNNLCGF